jgi:hypothetical protein
MILAGTACEAMRNWAVAGGQGPARRQVIFLRRALALFGRSLCLQHFHLSIFPLTQLSQNYNNSKV